MYLVACGALLAAGLVLNAGDRRALLLVLLVGASVFVPVPRETAEHFYTFCIAVEIAVALAAWYMRTKASMWVVDLCVLLVIAHVMGYALDGNLPFSPYRVVVKILESSQLLACTVLSPILAPILRNHDATTT